MENRTLPIKKVVKDIIVQIRNISASFLHRVVTRYTPVFANRTVTIPSGAYLFHGSVEKFSGTLKAGGDGLIWFSDSPKIAQLYIPRAGITMFVRPTDVARPDQDEKIQKLQREIGIAYNYDEVEWEGRRLKSFPTPKGWDRIPKDEEVERLLEKSGFEKDGNGFKIMMHGDKFLKAGEAAKGRLFVAKIKEPLTLWVKAKGDSDLTDLQYNDFDGFKKAKHSGHDGVLIDDFAQSKEYGNFGHLSVGLYKLEKLDIIKVVPAQYREWDYKAKGTPEYPNPPPSYLYDILKHKAA